MIEKLKQMSAKERKDFFIYVILGIVILAFAIYNINTIGLWHINSGLLLIFGILTVLVGFMSLFDATFKNLFKKKK